MRWAALLLAYLSLAACGGGAPIPAVDAHADMQASARFVAPGQGFDVRVELIASRANAARIDEVPTLSGVTRAAVTSERAENDTHVRVVQTHRVYAFDLQDVLIRGVGLAADAPPGNEREPSWLARAPDLRIRVRPELDAQRPGPLEWPGALPAPSEPPWLPIAAVLTLIAWVLLYLRTRGRAPDAEGPAVPVRAAHDPRAAARRALAGLADEPLRSASARQERVEGAAAIVRLLLEQERTLAALRRTSQEVMRAPQIDEAARARLAVVLDAADGVKYAGSVPDEAACAAVLAAARAFVDGDEAGGAA